jgi:hypothetical protein
MFTFTPEEADVIIVKPYEIRIVLHDDNPLDPKSSSQYTIRVFVKTSILPFKAENKTVPIKI